MVAYLRLFARVMAGGAAGAVVGWVHALEEEVGVAPLWEVLFQLMCYPVPQVRSQGSLAQPESAREHAEHELAAALRRS